MKFYWKKIQSNLAYAFSDVSEKGGEGAKTCIYGSYQNLLYYIVHKQNY